MKNHYELLGVVPTVQGHEIKRAFRRQIARYHPDKVQHLGPEFRDMAVSRAAELTEAYRVLMDAASRRVYDDMLDRERRMATRAAASGRGSSCRWPGDSGTSRERTCDPGVGERGEGRSRHARAARDVVRKAAIARLRTAVECVSPSAAPVSVSGFDAAYVVKPRTSLFGASGREIRLLARFVSRVDWGAVEEAWPLALRSGTSNGVPCLVLLGSGVSPPQELAAAVAEQRRRSRTVGPVVVPVDVRDWEVRFPPEAPEIVRQVLDRLRSG